METKSLILARQSIHTETGLIRVLPDRVVALCLLVVDRSGSMRKHGDAPRLAANGIIGAIRTAEGAERSMFGLYSFNHNVTLEVPPVLASRSPELTHYEADGDTALYQAAHEALSVGLEFHAFAANTYDAIAKVAITVISDGDDTVSKDYAGPCRHLAAVARENGFMLQAIGLGIDAKQLALRLGFDPGLAHTEEASAEGLHRATKHTSRSFTGTMSIPINPNRSSTPPGGV